MWPQFLLLRLLAVFLFVSDFEFRISSFGFAASRRVLIMAHMLAG